MQSEPKKDYLKERKKRMIWHRIVACLAVIVAVSTGYALILPAVTMEQQTPPASVKETQADWEETMPDTLTGDWGTDLAAVALSQIGYAESSTDTTVNDTGETCGYTRYGAWYGDEYGDWNGMFLAFCLHYAGIPEDAVKASADVSEMLKSAQEKGFYKEAGQYEPEAGDIAFLPDGQAGVVTEASAEGVSVAAGDINGTVEVIEKAEPLGYGSIETAASLYAGAETDGRAGHEDAAEDAGSVQSGDEAGSMPDGDEDRPADAGADPGSQPGADEAGEESMLTANEAEAQAEQSLRDYVLDRGFGNEDSSFIESLKDSNGQEIEPDEEGIYHLYDDEGYTWSISLYAPAGIPEAGIYVYDMPSGMTATDVQPRDITANDGTVIGHFSISEDGSRVVVEMLENTKIRLRVKFDISMEIETGEDGEPISPDIEFIPRESSDKGAIKKTGQINSDGQIEWVITANIPGWNGSGPYASWLIYDTISYPPSAPPPDLSKAEIVISYGETVQAVHSFDQAPEDEDIAFYWDTSEDPPFLYFVTRCSTHDCDGAAERPEGLSDEWCTHWALKEDSTITIRYVYPAVSDDSNSSILEEVDSIDNTANLLKDKKREDYSRINFEMPSIIEKAAMDNGQFVITFNAEHALDLSKLDEIVIEDEMSDNLFYMLGSINITATDEDGVVQVLTYGEDYTLETVDEDGSPSLHHLKITILYPGQYKYQITYQVTTEAGNKDDSYTNTASVEIWGNHFEDDQSGTISDFSSAAEEYVLSIHKTDIDAPLLVVPGARYGIYSSQGELLAEETTDEDGSAHFTGNPAAGFILVSNQLYYLQETEAPEGYQLSDARYWFYYSNSDQDEIALLIETAKAVGLYRETDGTAQSVSNHGYTDEPIEGSTESPAKPIEVQDQRIWYELPETGSTGTRMYTIAGLLLTGSAVTALYREKCKKRRHKK